MRAIVIEGVSKTYRVPHERHTTLAERLLSIFRPVPVENLPALREVTLDVPTGSFIGIVGANGSGKSTLLKVIAGLILPDSGHVHINGSVAPLLELGLGFQPELTARENVALYGALLGYPPAGKETRIDEVIAFAGLEHFRDAKLKSFSSGMMARLAFATALRAEADILLLDEVLAVGDASFQRKCFEVFDELRKQRKTIVLVSHDLGSVQRFSDRVYWIDKGRIVMAGDAMEVVGTYAEVSRLHAISVATQRKPMELPEKPVLRFGDQAVRFVHGSLETEDGTPIARVSPGSRVVLHLIVEFHIQSTEPAFGFGVRQLNGLGSHIVYSTFNRLLGVSTGTFAPGDRLDVRIPFTAALVNGRYTTYAAVGDVSQGIENPRIHDWINEFISFSVDDSPCRESLADLLAEFEFIR